MPTASAGRMATLVVAGIIACTAALTCCALGAAVLAGATIPSSVAGPRGPVGDGRGSIAAGIAVDWALAQVGTPYVWGGETPGVGFDCSGLVQAAYARAGIALPRVAQAQFDAGPLLPTGAPLVPGDLVFFGSSTSGVEHVGMVVGTSGGRSLMVDAPHTGADVRVEPFTAATGTAWGAERYVGATRPGG